MSDQLLIVLTRPSDPDEWGDWTLNDAHARLALLGRDMADEFGSGSVPQGVDWRHVDLCVVRGGRDSSWTIINELFNCVPAEIDLQLLIHSIRPPDPAWVENKVRQMSLSPAGAEKAREVLSKYRGYGLGEGAEGVRNRNIISFYVTAARGQGDYEKALEGIRRLLLRPSPGERIALIKHKLGLLLFNGLAAEVDYIANCMSDGDPDEALRILRGLLNDFRRETAEGRLQLNSFADWVELLRWLVGGSLLTAGDGDVVYSVGCLVEEYRDMLSNDGFRHVWDDLILLAGLRPRHEEEPTSLPGLERDEHSQIALFMERLDRLGGSLRPCGSASSVTAEEIKSLIAEDVWLPLRERRWAVSGENVTSFPTWFRQLDATLDELRRYLPQ